MKAGRKAISLHDELVVVVYSGGDGTHLVLFLVLPRSIVFSRWRLAVLLEISLDGSFHFVTRHQVFVAFSMVGGERLLHA